MLSLQREELVMLEEKKTNTGMTISGMKEAWDRLGDVPVTEELELDQEYEFDGYTYEVGTDCHYIWHVFDDMYWELSGGKSWFEMMGY